jgi:hypothetical protein
VLSAVLAAPLAAQDSAFRALQDRGKTAMGVDQYTSLHRFDPLPDGGRIALVRDSTDAAGVATIRAHLWDISRAFAAGEFAVPGFVHGREVPGTRVMALRKNAIRYVFHTRDSAAARAVHDFLAFQRMDHRVDGNAPHRH